MVTTAVRNTAMLVLYPTESVLRTDCYVSSNTSSGIMFEIFSGA